jgi:hypothetical protein
MSDKERQRLCRQRKREAIKGLSETLVPVADQNLPVTEAPAIVPVMDLPAVTVTALSGDLMKPVTPVTVTEVDHGQQPNVTAANVYHGGHRPLASQALTLAAIGLAGTGLTMNGWFARSLGSSDFSGWLFLAVGIAADCAALALPSASAAAWQAGRRAVALAGWLVWLAVFAFALVSSVGFASLNVADVTAHRAAIVTPAVTAAKVALLDATSARDRECRTGTGKFCRQREATVTERQTALDQAMAAVAATADPQTVAAMRLVNWISRGTLTPSADDLAMLRLALMTLLPQCAGLLLMVGRRSLDWTNINRVTS